MSDAVLERPPEQAIEEAEPFLELDNWETGESYELIEGELVPRARTDNEHGVITARIAYVLKQYSFQVSRVSRVSESSSAFYTRYDDRTVRKPDVSLTFYTDAVPRNRDSEFYMRVAPDLIVEVISPGNSAEEMDEKVQEWFAFGVKTVWLVFPVTRNVWVFPDKRHAEIFFGNENITGGNVLPGFESAIRAFFED